MLSYRHAFHVGNHADVLKHIVLLQVLQHATQKDKPFWYIDTHAGAGNYALDKGYATQNAEFAGGIGQLWDIHGLPQAIADYIDLVRSFNPDHALRHYPGSPVLAFSAMRADDRLRLFELHPNDYKLLNQSFKALGLGPNNRRVMTEAQDGFAGIKALLPPPPRRAVVLIDPPYEEKKDYQRVVDMLKDSLTRFATGTYIIWYPLLQRPEPQQMLEKLKKLPLKSWLHVSLTVQTPSIDGFGMHGSGLFIVNPPYTLPQLLTETMPVLLEKLGLDEGADYVLESQIS
ncbi:MAG: 23S rRNA (adenine(2030)-N(6))-methyltransferase RlmJ [Betaproteobacteria bacterium HGW-Betaproteobacteria-1]|jgi:23S rRNA (adenine2030-N6)-methyltransferase|nr:MAG: 23S rRNA (adenine(2030)-N(6))-methyltransferase RlmJ [Betaproteobacteria bacterium HGW-Betaproteobacteria-1]